MSTYLDIVVRSVCVYLFMLIALRVFGKNQLSQLNAGDIILLLLISNAVQNAMVGPDTSLSGGLVAAFALLAINFLLKQLMFRYRSIDRLINDEPITLLIDGEMDEEAMRKAQITPEELAESIREHGVTGLAHVQLATLEVDGNISIVSKPDTPNGSTRFSRHNIRNGKRRTENNRNEILTKRKRRT